MTERKMSLRDRIFDDIRSDYNKSGKASFLYQYLREGKLKERCDKNPGKEKALIHKAATDFMYNMGYPLAKEKKDEAQPIDPDAYTEMADGLTFEEENRRLNVLDPHRLTEEQEGKSRKQAEEAEKAKKAEEKPSPSRTKNTALDMIDAWYSQRGCRLPEMSGSVASEEEYQKLFVALNNSKCTSAFVPVRIDPVTGAGLFILGRDYYPEGYFPVSRNYSCAFCIISFWSFDKDDPSGVRLECGTTKENVGKCDDVKEALKFFEAELGENRQDGLFEIVNCNGNKPEQCPKSLEIYFADYEGWDDFDMITEDEMKESRDDFQKFS